MQSSFLVDMGCIHNLLLKTTFDHLTAAVKERLERWDTTATLFDGSGLPVYGKIGLTDRIRNSLFPVEFLVSSISNEGSQK